MANESGALLFVDDMYSTCHLQYPKYIHFKTCMCSWNQQLQHVLWCVILSRSTLLCTVYYILLELHGMLLLKTLQKGLVVTYKDLVRKCNSQNFES